MSDETERLEVIEHVHAEGVAAAESLGRGLDRKADRADVWRVAVVVALLGAAVSIGVSWLASSQAAELRAERVAEQAKTAAEQKSTREAISALEEANRDLRERGQQPVPPPSEFETGETLVAAATARVLANLPAAPMPTNEQVGNAVAAYMTTHPVVVNPSRVADEVAAYLTANPPPAGEKGVKGDPGEKGDQGEKGADGPPPTPEQIMAVFNQAAAQNPDLLCAGKGKFTEVRGFVRVPSDLVPQERAFWVCLPQ